MELLDHTTESAFLPQIKGHNLDEVVRRLVAALASDGVVDDPAGLVKEVLRREAADCTAIGGGLVLPHGRHESLRSVQLAVATLAEPLPLQGVDGLPVDVVILLVGPLGDPRVMLQVLAKLARLVKDGDYLHRLRTAGNALDLRDVFASE